MRNSIALLTTIYPGSEIYFDDFFGSLRHQTLKDFDIVVVNDNAKLDIKSEFNDLNIFVINSSVSISKNREAGINYIIEKKYFSLILCDIDDYFDPTRVEKSVMGLKFYDAVVNDLNIISSKKELLEKNYFQQTHDIPSPQSLNFILEKNICGFSNTALNISKLNIVDFPENIQILDWYWFTLLIESGLKVGFIPESLTFYRQHSNNLIGIDDFTLDLFKKMLKLKVFHYKALSEKSEEFKSLQSKYQNMLLADDIILQKAIIKNKNINNKPLWWENIKL